jgi:hypothetical protein
MRAWINESRFNASLMAIGVMEPGGITGLLREICQLAVD